MLLSSLLCQYCGSETLLIIWSCVPFVILLLQITLVVKQLFICVTDKELIGSQGLLAPFAPAAILTIIIIISTDQVRIRFSGLSFTSTYIHKFNIMETLSWNPLIIQQNGFTSIIKLVLRFSLTSELFVFITKLDLHDPRRWSRVLFQNENRDSNLQWQSLMQLINVNTDAMGVVNHRTSVTSCTKIKSTTQIVLYCRHSTSVLSFYIDVVLTLSIYSTVLQM